MEIKENSLVVCLQQIQKIEDQQKRYQDLEKKAEKVVSPEKKKAKATFQSGAGVHTASRRYWEKEAAAL